MFDSGIPLFIRSLSCFHIVLPLEAQPRTLYSLIGCGTRWTAKVRHGGHIQLFSAARFETMASAAGLNVVRRRWSYHALLQVLDVLYFSWLDRRGPVVPVIATVSLDAAPVQIDGIEIAPFRSRMRRLEEYPAVAQDIGGQMIARCESQPDDIAAAHQRGLHLETSGGPAGVHDAFPGGVKRRDGIVAESG